MYVCVKCGHTDEWRDCHRDMAGPRGTIQFWDRPRSSYGRSVRAEVQGLAPYCTGVMVECFPVDPVEAGW